MDPNSRLKPLLANNRDWAQKMVDEDPHYFDEHLAGQKPEFLWIGCSDSRVPANELVGLRPGRVFVHRNVANLVQDIDLNLLSVLQYGIDYLDIHQIIVCGHYDCGGVKAAMSNRPFGLIDNWLRTIKRIYDRHRDEVDALPTEEERLERMCELNVRYQVLNVCKTSIIQRAWDRGADITVSGIIYDLKDGILRDLDVHVKSKDQLEPIFGFWD
jgi:carbonic anhydrase